MRWKDASVLHLFSGIELMEDHGTVEGRKRTPPVQWHWNDPDSVCSYSKSLLNKKPRLIPNPTPRRSFESFHLSCTIFL